MMTDTPLSAACAPAAEASHPATIWLEVQRGRTLYPRRPVLTSRFLIGAASNCHLQLGGDGIPFLHSLLAVEGSSVAIEAFVPWPELRVNGQPVRTAQLCDGDEVAIGPFTFTVHLRASLDAEPVDPLYAPIPLELAQTEEPEEPLAELSAGELIERIEAVEGEVEAFESHERRGAAALLDALRQAGEAEADATAVEAVPAALLADLSALSEDLERRLVLLREREQEQAERAAALLAAQARLSEQLELAAQSLAAEEDRVRASA